jgi:hypothetical protein
MVNKTIKVAVAALFIAPCGAIIAGPGIATSACGNGNNVTISGTLTCGAKGGDTSLSLTRKRGDKVVFPASVMNQFKNAEQAQASGTFEVPAIGDYSYYMLGKTKILIGSFDLNASNAQAPAALRTIIKAAKTEHPEANSLIWYGRALDGETAFVEVAEFTTDAKNTNSTIPYKKTNATTVQIFTPQQEEPIVVDMKPIR